MTGRCARPACRRPITRPDDQWRGYCSRRCEQLAHPLPMLDLVSAEAAALDDLVARGLVARPWTAAEILGDVRRDAA